MSPGKKSHLYPHDPRAETALFVIHPQKIKNVGVIKIKSLLLL